MNFKIQIENFEGPIDVLLQMIEKRKMAISDISLADITDDYIDFVKNLDEQDISNMTHFIFVASTLTLIKSKSLLPSLELNEEEEGDIEELKRRIEEFKLYQNASQKIKEIFSGKPSFFFAKTKKKEISFNPHPSLNRGTMKESFYSVLQEIPEKKVVKKEASIRISVHIEEMMDSLENRIKKAMNTNFSSFVKSHLKEGADKKELRVYRVVGFLAMLELVKNGIVNVLQEKNFTSIYIKNND